jgi:hypothetical protein
MSVRLGIREGTISAAVFAVVLTTLVSFDPRVHEHIADLFSSSGGVAPLGDRVGDLVSALWVAARYQSLENAPLLVFTTIGAVLTLFMLRS